MASEKLGRRAFGVLLNMPDVVSFHRLLWLREPQHVPLMYIVLTKTQMVLTELDADDLTGALKITQSNTNSKQQQTTDIAQFFGTQRKKSAQSTATESTPEAVEGSFDASPNRPIVIKYEWIEELLLHGQAEDRFGIVLNDQRANFKSFPLPVVLQFSTCYRKAVTEQLQILYNTHTIQSNNLINYLRVRFIGGEDTALRHAAERLFDNIPSASAQTSTFYRRGYMFRIPARADDKYELLDNRPCSTYIFNPQLKGDEKDAMHMVTRFLPERPINPVERESLLSFQMFVENVAHAIAQREYDLAAPPRSGVYEDNYFIPDQGPYRKKMNIVGDQALWFCYRVHVFTPKREIGVIGVRRSFIPPLLDTFQDMVFVLYGENSKTSHIVPQPGFMEILETIVDTLSPASAAFQQRIKRSQPIQKALGPTGKEAKDAMHMHPTYYDRVVLQARANALFLNKDSYAWLKNRPGLGIEPLTRFIDVPCNRLAQIFCRSIIKKMVSEQAVAKAASEEKDKKKGKRNAEAAANAAEGEEQEVGDPLSIIFRMQSDETDETAADTTGTAPDGSGPAAGQGISQADWKRRISRYFAYCVDGGLFPNELTIRFLTLCETFSSSSDKDEDDKKKQENSETRHVTKESMQTIDRVIDFLLHMSPPYQPYVQTPNLIDKFKLCQLGGTEFIPGCEFNEWVMVRILETDYLEQLQERSLVRPTLGAAGSAGVQHQNVLKKPDVISYLLKMLLQRRDNLELIEAVTAKVISKAEQLSKKKQSQGDSGSDKLQATQTQQSLEHMQQLIAPAIDLVRDGNNLLKTCGIRLLTCFLLMNIPPARVLGSEVEDVQTDILDVRKKKKKGAVKAKAGNDVSPIRLAMTLVKDSKCTALLIACLRFLRTAYRILAEKHPDDNIMHDKDFLEVMLAFLDDRLGSGARHHPRILGDVAMLVLLIFSKNQPGQKAIKPKVIGHLMDIVSEHSNYSFIMPEITGALTVLFWNSRNDDEDPKGSELQNSAPVHATTLVKTLGACAQKDKMQVCSNLLTVLDTLVEIKHKFEPQQAPAGDETKAELDEKKKKADEVKKSEKRAEKRFNILKELATSKEFAFKTILEAVAKQAADVRKDHTDLQTKAMAGEAPPLTEKDNAKFAAAVKVQKLTVRFDKRLKQGKEADWKFDKFKSQREAEFQKNEPAITVEDI